MRLLFLVPYAPDPIRVRPYNLVRSLARRGHRVTLATLWSSQNEREYLSGLGREGIEVIACRLTRARSAWNCIRTLPRPMPLQSAYCWQPRLLETVKALLRDGKSRFDLVHIEHLRGSRYGTQLQSAPSGTVRTVPVVWDSVDSISNLFEQSARSSKSRFGRLAARFELPRTRWYEAWLVKQFDRVLVTSEQDRRAFCDLLQEFALQSDGHVSGMDKIQVLSNGVDLNYFQPRNVPRATQTLLLTGKMSYHANVTAALYLVTEIMPLVWERFPYARVQIVGHNPPREVKHLERKYPERVFVSGTVEDLRPFLAQATLAVAPLTYGTGIQNKVLEAMAMATPVAATTQAVSALAVRNEQEVLIGDDPESFSQQVVRLLRNPSLRDRLGQNGRRYVESHHEWDRVTEELERIYQEVIAEQHAAV